MLLDLRMDWVWISPRFIDREWRSKKSGQAQFLFFSFSIVIFVSLCDCHGLGMGPEQPGGGVRNDAEESRQIASLVVSEAQIRQMGISVSLATCISLVLVMYLAAIQPAAKGLYLHARRHILTLSAVSFSSIHYYNLL
ncbi:uncharacterized protein BDV17DRAFT_182066 [Aspergillus undulatus]|uniref:uncharacterized protein n=1 Tax=Aspergillus undulatus TaxID=1810928 RepID=UPI003CCCE7A2